MKLTAPPPPPPEPTDPSGSGQPDLNAPAVSAAPPENPAAPVFSPRPVSWPAWFIGADFLMVVLVLSLAFLVSSFVARNSDAWLHLAAGKRFVTGEASPGTDPFSYSASGRAWVNHSLLFDVAAYLLYSGNGALLIVIKALAVVLSFGLLLAIRRPAYSFWPWAAIAGVAVVAAAPQMLFRPIVASMLMLSITLVLLFRLPHRPGSWRFPIAIGVTFWLWALLDSWFILGPIALGLVLLGKVIESNLRGAKPPEQAEPETLGSPPAVPVLGKALLIGILACMLTPNHVRIWQLPFELIGSHNAAVDLKLRAILATPLDKAYWDSPAQGVNVNGLAYALLFVGGGVVLGMGVGINRVSQIMLWIGFALLSLLSVVAIPFFAIVAVPLVASQLNLYSTYFVPKTWGDIKTRFLLLGSAGGRVACVLLLVVACTIAWPGWLQPESANAAFARRVGWGVEPDAGLVRVAQQLQVWRESGKIPPESHGIIASTDLANYCAWYAPAEKVFLNTDFTFHRDELERYFVFRKEVFNPPDSQLPNAQELGSLLDKMGVDYLVVASSQADAPQIRSIQTSSSTYLWIDHEHWSPWYLDGRATITGWRSNTGKPDSSSSFDALRLDPLVQAFGPGVERLPETVLKPLPPVEGWEGEFLHGASVCPLGADEAIGWSAYRLLKQVEYSTNEDICQVLTRVCPSPVGVWPQEMVPYLAYRRRPISETIVAAPLLALRAAHRAIAADPDHPDGYFCLFQALQDSDLPLTGPERSLASITALRQCLFRMPPPERYRPHVFRANPAQIALELADSYAGLQKPGISIDIKELQILSLHPLNDGVIYVVPNRDGKLQLMPRWQMAAQRIQNKTAGPFLQASDMAREMMELSIKYIEKENPAESEAILKNLEPKKKALEAALVRKNGEYEREKLQGGQVKLLAQVRSALRYNLVGEALKILTEKWPELAKESPESVADFVLLRIALELAVGKLEDAIIDLEGAPRLMESPLVPEKARPVMAELMRQLTYEKFMLEGNYKLAGENTEKTVSGLLGVDPPLTPEEKAFKPAVFLALGGSNQLAQLAELAPINPIGTVMRDTLRAELIQPMAQRQQKLQAVRANASNFYAQRGILSLLEGDIPAAKLRFEQSQQKGVPEWGIPDYRNASAERYLRLIVEAEKRASGK